MIKEATVRREQEIDLLRNSKPGNFIFSENLKYLRNSRNLKQREISEALKIKLCRYQSWEEGRAYPQPHYLLILASYFEISDIASLFISRLAMGIKNAPAYKGEF